MDLILAPELTLPATLFLIAVSAGTSFLTASVGIGGGIVLLAIMGLMVPAHALIPVHGLVQIGSNGGRTAIMIRQVDRSVLLPFLLGSLIGAAIGGLTAVQLPPMVLKIGLGCFILYTVWGPKVRATGRHVVVLTGVFSTFLTMFFGATGMFVSAMVKTLRLGRMEHVATHSACMVGQHVVKVLAFGLLGFAYSPWLGLIIAMIISGFIGTVLGKTILMRQKDENFHKVLAWVLSILAAKLIYDGVMLYWA